MKHMINWFEIPATDINRAAKFYGNIFGVEITVSHFGEFKMAMFPGDQDSVFGSLVEHEMYTPSESAGPMIYLNGGDNLQPYLDKVEAAGGKIIQPKSLISEEHGHMAIFIDTEGNRMALHSPN